MKLKSIPAVMLALLSASIAQAADITGAGSTFALPIYTKWADAYQKSGGGKVNYQGIGSSGGIKQIQAKTVDFAGSDAPLKDEDLAKEGLFQFPTVVGGVVPAINVPGVKAGELTLSGPVLGDIYLGKIKKWNDPAIVALNPKVKLPDLDIAVVRRADGSGTSFIWTNYLSKVSPEWKSKVGEGTTVNWPTGTGGKGNDGVAAFVQRLPGAIGYVEWAYAKQNHMVYTAMKNESGAVVQPDTETFKAAAAGADWIQLREKDLGGKESFDLARSAMQSIQENTLRTRIIVNDRVDVALAAGAGGVHLSENGFSVPDARRLVTRVEHDSGKSLDFLIGVSCHSLGSALGAARDGADYIYFSPIFHTPSKAFYGPPQGVDRLCQICKAVSIPVIAIGGITLENAASCYAAGAAGVAAIRLFQDATDLPAIVQSLRSPS